MITSPPAAGGGGTTTNASDLTSGTLAAARLPALTGDVSSNAGSAATTLATVNSTVGSFGSATKALVAIFNAKGLATAVSEITITPAVGSVTGFGTGVATALAVNVGSAGAPVVLGGALGTPSSGSLANCTFPSTVAIVLVPTAVKTGSYTAAASDFVPVDTTSGSVTITLPTAPANGTQIGIKQVIRGGTNTVTYACGGSDVINKAGGVTSGTLTLSGQAVIVQYKATGAIWYVIADDMPYGSLIANAQTWSAVQTFVAPVLGTPGSGNLSNCTALPVGSVTGFGTGVATALAINVGSAGAPVLLNGALGTPSSGALTNCTLLPPSGVVGTAAILGANTFTALQTITQASANAGVLASTGYSLTGSNATSMLDFAGTWNTSGSPELLTFNLTNTASTAPGNNIDTGSTYLALKVGSTKVFNVSVTGRLAVTPHASFASIGWIGSGLNGFNYFATTSTVAAISGNGVTVGFNNAGVKVQNVGKYAWGNNSDASGSSNNTMLTSPSAAVVQSGDADAAAPIAQTTQVQSVVAGTTDTAGTAWTRTGSKGTGTAAGGNLVDKTGFSAKATGSTQHTTVDRKITVAKGKVLTDNTAVSLFEVALPTLAMCGGTIEATVVCTDGTDMQSFSQTITYSAVNKGGSYTTSITAITGDKSVSAGTLVNTWSILNGTNKVTIQLSSDTSLTPSTNAFLVYYTVKNNSEQATTVQ